eukprot:gnl/Trimastix_PCT/2289.p1 GENE.gnl/Trimastix_PCT/2289~~gnl/Trimastix_PCT/2289.p1  ORF type:complete len:622 (-),score=206.19 gnl/Trimastix_PCT/2289:43-1908(-)
MKQAALSFLGFVLALSAFYGLSYASFSSGICLVLSHAVALAYLLRSSLFAVVPFGVLSFITTFNWSRTFFRLVLVEDQRLFFCIFSVVCTLVCPLLLTRLVCPRIVKSPLIYALFLVLGDTLCMHLVQMGGYSSLSLHLVQYKMAARAVVPWFGITGITLLAGLAASGIASLTLPHALTLKAHVLIPAASVKDGHKRREIRRLVLASLVLALLCFASEARSALMLSNTREDLRQEPIPTVRVAGVVVRRFGAPIMNYMRAVAQPLPRDDLPLLERRTQARGNEACTSRMPPATRKQFSGQELVMEEDRHVKPLDAVFDQTAKAAQLDAKFVVWSENGADTFRYPEGRKGTYKEELFSHTILLERAAHEAREHKVYLVVAYHEHVVDPEDNTTLLHSASRLAVFRPDGSHALTYTKRDLMPHRDEHIVSGACLEPDAETPVLDTAYGRVAFLFGYELAFPDRAAELARKRVDFVIAPTWDAADMGHAPAGMSALRAMEGGFSLFRVAAWGLSAAHDCFGVQRSAMDYLAYPLTEDERAAERSHNIAMLAYTFEPPPWHSPILVLAELPAQRDALRAAPVTQEWFALACLALAALVVLLASVAHVAKSFVRKPSQENTQRKTQ